MTSLADDSDNLELFKQVMGNRHIDTIITPDFFRGWENFIDVHATPLWFASRFGAIKIMKYAIDQGADVNRVYFGDPILYNTGNNYEATKLLLEAGADPNIDVEYTNPIFGAIENGNVEVFDLLREYDANIHIEYPEGNNILDVATENVLRDRWHPNQYWASYTERDERMLWYLLSDYEIFHSLNKIYGLDEARKYNDKEIVEALKFQSLKILSYGSCVKYSIDISKLPVRLRSF